YPNAASWSPLPVATQEAGPLGAAGQGKPWAIARELPQPQFSSRRPAPPRPSNGGPRGRALVPPGSPSGPPAATLLTLPPRARVLVLENDHSSAVLEWTTRAAAGRFSGDGVPRPPDGDWTAAVLAAIEKPGAPPVALASISSVHWADGGVVEIDRV